MGYGFAKQGQEAIKRNRNITSQRKSMSENPYAAFVKNPDRKSDHYAELKQWRDQREKQERITICTIAQNLLKLTTL